MEGSLKSMMVIHDHHRKATTSGERYFAAATKSSGHAPKNNSTGHGLARMKHVKRAPNRSIDTDA